MELSITEIFQHLPDFWLVKDAQLRYVHANNNFLTLTRLRCDELAGINDYEMPWGKTHAQKYRQDDLEVLAGNPKLNYLESQVRPHNQIVSVKVNKRPIHKHGEIIGIICDFVEIPPVLPAIRLSPRQRSCLKLLVKGLSAKQIAAHEGLSVRTIEYYLSILKDKFNCHNKAELIIVALNLGI